ncbi:MAG: 4Fe-4S cluster-binding domain-containing protein [Lachnospira sp.]|nr:4Fe-4S cluster-binding domain-containing protein [Lachnospira sp.]
MDRYIIFGAGQYGEKIAEHLGRQNIECFIDNDKDKIGKEIYGIDIKDVEYLSGKKNAVIIALTGNSLLSVKEQMNKKNIKNYLLWFDKFPDLFDAQKQKDIYILMEELEKIIKNSYEKYFKLQNDIDREMISLESLPSSIVCYVVLALKTINYNESYFNNYTNIKKMFLIKLLISIKKLILEKNLIQTLFDVWSECNKVLSYNNSKEYKISRIDYMITERCSLKCQDCLNLMQYYTSPVDFNLKEIKKYIDILTENVDYIYELRILGGEPFMNSNIYDICDYISLKPNVENIIIFTNATIPLAYEKAAKLNKKKILFYISDYGNKIQKIEDLEGQLKKLKIKFCIVDYKKEKWIKHSEFKKISLEKEKAIGLFNKCSGRDCPVVLKNKLFICEYIANADNLNAIPNEKTNYVSLDQDHVNLKENIKSYLEREKPLSGCFYCSRWLDSNAEDLYVKAARQIKKPLLYERCE